MKKYNNILIFGLITLLFACNHESQKASSKKQIFACNTLANKNVIYKIAKSVIDKHDNNLIWNLSEVDTTEFFTTEDYFTNSKSKNRLVLVGGNAGLSSGTANNLLILFSCSDTFNILWSGQVGDFTKENIVDLNGDGVEEIVITSSMMWMGECNDNFNIINFKDGNRNQLFTAHSNSIIDCGSENYAEIYNQGDTLESKFDCSLVKTGRNNFAVQQIKTVKIHNGGQTDEEIIQNLKIFTDTTKVNLN